MSIYFAIIIGMRRMSAGMGKKELSANETILKIEQKCNKMNFTTFDVIEKFDNFNLVKNSFCCF